MYFFALKHKQDRKILPKVAPKFPIYLVLIGKYNGYIPKYFFIYVDNDKFLKR